MKKNFLAMIVISFLVIVGASSYGATPRYWIEVDNIIETPVGENGLVFQVSIKSWDAESLEGILVQVKYKEPLSNLNQLLIPGMFLQVEGETNEKGIVNFIIPDKAGGSSEATISLPNFPESGKKVATIIYVRHLKYFGYTFTAVEGIGGKENYFTETSSFSNIAIIKSLSADKDIEKILDAASNHRMQTIISVDHIFLNYEFNEQGLLTNFSLYPDYLVRWSEYAEKIQPFTDWIIGFYPIDEPYWIATVCGKSFEETRKMMEKIVFQIRRAFPQKKIVGSIALTKEDLKLKTVYGYPLPKDAQEFYGIPDYDWVAIYYYWASYVANNLSPNKESFQKKWEVRMKSFSKYLRPHQRIVLIPGTFTFSWLNNTQKIEQELINLVPYYLQLAKRNVKIIAIMPFLWPSWGDLVGLEEMPNLQMVWGKIGKEITQK